MTACGDQSVCGVIGAGKGTVRQHIAVKVVADSVAVKTCQTVVGVILEAAVRSTCNITRRVIAEGLGGNDRIIGKIFDRSRRDSAQVIISITQFGRIFKYFFFDYSRQIIIRILKARNHSPRSRSFYRGFHLVSLVSRCYGTAVWLHDSRDAVVLVVGIRGYSVCPVGDTDKVTVFVIRIAYIRIVGVGQLDQISYAIVLVADGLTVGIGAARYAVEGVKGAGDISLAVSRANDISVVVVCKAYNVLGRGVAADPAVCVIHERDILTSCVGNLFAEIQLVVLISLCTARNKCGKGLPLMFLH